MRIHAHTMHSSVCTHVCGIKGRTWHAVPVELLKLRMRMYSSVSVLLVLVAMTSGYAGGASTGGKNYLICVMLYLIVCLCSE